MEILSKEKFSSKKGKSKQSSLFSTNIEDTQSMEQTIKNIKRANMNEEDNDDSMFKNYLKTQIKLIHKNPEYKKLKKSLFDI